MWRSGGCAGLWSYAVSAGSILGIESSSSASLVGVLDGLLVSVAGLVGVGCGIGGWRGCWIAGQYSLSML